MFSILACVFLKKIVQCFFCVVAREGAVWFLGVEQLMCAQFFLLCSRRIGIVVAVEKKPCVCV